LRCGMPTPSPLLSEFFLILSPLVSCYLFRHGTDRCASATTLTSLLPRLPLSRLPWNAQNDHPVVPFPRCQIEYPSGSVDPTSQKLCCDHTFSPLLHLPTSSSAALSVFFKTSRRPTPRNSLLRGVSSHFQISDFSMDIPAPPPPPQLAVMTTPLSLLYSPSRIPT